MAHRLACDRSTEIAGIVSLAGAVWKDPSKCNPTSPVAVLQVHGTDDTTISYDGGEASPLDEIPGLNLPDAPSAPETVAIWAEKNGCDPALEPVTPNGRLDLVVTLPGEETRIERHACAEGVAELWTIEGGSHIPSFQPTWAERIYEFLQAHPKD